MKSVLLEKSELLALLDILDVSGVAGLEQYLPELEPFERSIVLEDGRSRLLEKRRLLVAEDHYEIDRDLGAMLAVVNSPQTVLRIRRSASGSDEELWCWYFVSGPKLVLLLTSGREHFELDWVRDVNEVLDQIVEILPVFATPTAANFRVAIGPEEVDSFAALFDAQGQALTFTIVEADEPALIKAEQLHHDLTEPEWSGLIDFMACTSGKATVSRRLLALRGQELSWLAWQEDPEGSELRFQSVTDDTLEELLKAHVSGAIPQTA